MIGNRISKLGREQIENAKEIILCKSNAYFIAKFGDRTPKFDPDHFVALVIYKNGFNQLVFAGELETWRFDELKNGTRSIRRINKDVSVKIYSDDDIAKFVAIEIAERAAFMDSVKKFNAGDKSELISLLNE